MDDQGKSQRRKLSELDLIYQVNPNALDVYVEGEYDRGVLIAFFRAFGVDHIKVYKIEMIEIPEKYLLDEGLGDGNKDRVVYLSKHFRRSGIKNGACIIDADFAFVEGTEGSEPPLFETDYASIDLYFLTPETVEKFVMLTPGEKQAEIKNIFHALIDFIKILFVLRFLNKKLNLNLTWLEHQEREITYSAEYQKFSFDLDGFIQKLLHKNGKFEYQGVIRSAIDNFDLTKFNDSRKVIRARDFFSLFSHFLKKHIRDCGDGELLKRQFTLAHPFEQLKNEKMFRSLLSYFSVSVE